MKFSKIFLFLAAVCASGSHDFMISKFLVDFFRQKNVMLTVNACWNTDEMRTFLKSISFGENAKQVAVYKNNYNFNQYTSHLSNDNYFVIDLNECNHAWLLIEQINETELFRSHLKYLVLTKNLEEITVRLKNYSIYPASELVIAEVRQHYTVLHQPYRTGRNSDIIWEDYGLWSEETGLIEHISRTPLSRRRHDLKQAEIKILFVVTDNKTWNHLDDFRFPRVDTFTKQDYGTIRSFLDYCNVDAIYIGTSYFGYYVNETGKWNGIVNELYHKRADLSGSSVFFTAERFEMIDFIKVLNPAPIKFLLKKPPLSFVRNIFVQAFEGGLWLFIGIITSVLGLVLYTILNLEAKSEEINNKSEFSCVDITLIIFEAICQQGTPTDPKRYSSRIAAVILFINFMFIYVSYSAYIVVLLQSQTEIKTPKELLETAIDVGVQNTNYLKFYLAQAPDEIRQLFAKKVYPDGYFPIEDGMAKVRRGFFAFNVELAGAFNYILEKFTDYDVCSLQELTGFPQNLQSYPATPKNSPYKEIFKTSLLRVEEVGIQKRNFVRYFIKPKCYVRGSTFESVGIVETYQCVLVFLYGIALSLVMCALENITAYCRNKARSSILMNN